VKCLQKIDLHHLSAGKSLGREFGCVVSEQIDHNEWEAGCFDDRKLNASIRSLAFGVCLHLIAAAG
jgi:hypothetical protein